MEEEKKAPEAAKAAEPEMLSLPAKPRKPRPKEDTATATLIAKRYLSVAALEKIVKAKKAQQKKKALAQRFKAPETPEEFYERGQKYQAGARCAVPFQTRSEYYGKAAEMFAGAGDYQDAPELAGRCAALAESSLTEGCQQTYAEAVGLKESASTSDDWFKAARVFERIPGYQDADRLAEECERRYQKLRSAKRPLIALALALVFALALGSAHLVQTDAFRYQAAKIAYAMGLDAPATVMLNSIESSADTDELLRQIYYDRAVNNMNRGNYASAAEELARCGEYEDSAALLQTCNYELGVDELALGDAKEAVDYLRQAAGYEDADQLRLEVESTLLAETEVGEKVPFGTAEYILLDRQDDRCLLLSAKLSGETSFAAQPGAVTWATSDLRAFWNGQEYLDSKFTAGEQARILSTDLGNGVSDRLFLLSQEEYLRYQPVMGEKKALWWLRDNGSAVDTIQFVSYDGAVMDAGYPADTASIQGRAALWVSLS